MHTKKKLNHAKNHTVFFIKWFLDNVDIHHPGDMKAVAGLVDLLERAGLDPDEVLKQIGV